MAEKIFRCAVYTRKSTEDGLEQEFNSLDAQYEACAAYALSQRHEGWVLVKERYDDGGFSGGNMERPGLKRLLADVEAGSIDIILLYKIDRLTRSLTDFSRIVDVLDRAKASFVSITQSFNTTTSMGRLTLNMLLSFAQFEREVTGERIRDKIAASKRKGMWMGGPVPLGYEVKDRKLLVNSKEAEQVRHIMRRYLVLGSVPALVEELEREEYRTKVQRRTSGPHKGGCLYRRGTLYHLLSNRIYRGMTVHKGTAHAGEHQPIVDEDLFAQVQMKLADNASGLSRRRKHRQPSLLTGKLFDGDGRAMTPSHATRPNKRYRYYVTRPDEVDGSPAWRVPAHDLEQLVCGRVASRLAEHGFVLDLQEEGEFEAAVLQQVLARADLAAATLRSGSDDNRIELLSTLVQRIDLAEDSASITLSAGGLREALGTAAALQPEAPVLIITIPAVRIRRGQQMRLVVPGPAATDQPLPVRRDERLITLVAEALQARELVLAHPSRSLASIAAEHGRCRTRLGKLVGLSCLAPDIIEAIVEGKQPETLTARRLDDPALPLEWVQQRKVLGLR
jgi:DNA invertase Pin-like site-specific DNA recombinase